MVFQQNKVEIVKTLGNLQPLDIPCKCWEEFMIYFIIGVPKLEGENVIMVVIDRLTNYAHFCSLSHPFSASRVAIAFMDIVKKLHGNTKIIATDIDPIFTRKFWT